MTTRWLLVFCMSVAVVVTQSRQPSSTWTPIVPPAVRIQSAIRSAVSAQGQKLDTLSRSGSLVGSQLKQAAADNVVVPAHRLIASGMSRLNALLQHCPLHWAAVGIAAAIIVIASLRSFYRHARTTSAMRTREQLPLLVPEFVAVTLLLPNKDQVPIIIQRDESEARFLHTLIKRLGRRPTFIGGFPPIPSVLCQKLQPGIYGVALASEGNSITPVRKLLSSEAPVPTNAEDTSATVAPAEELISDQVPAPRDAEAAGEPGPTEEAVVVNVPSGAHLKAFKDVMDTHDRADHRQNKWAAHDTSTMASPAKLAPHPLPSAPTDEQLIRTLTRLGLDGTAMLALCPALASCTSHNVVTVKSTLHQHVQNPNEILQAHPKLLLQPAEDLKANLLVLKGMYPDKAAMQAALVQDVTLLM